LRNYNAKSFVMMANPVALKEIAFLDLGSIPYREAWEYQEKLFNELIASKQQNRVTRGINRADRPGYLLFCEHPPVITLGKSGHEQHLLMNPDWLAERGVEYVKTNRGGDITFHGPGQIVGYPILDLDQFFTDIHRYMRSLEEVIIRTLVEYGLQGSRMKGATGVWLDPEDPARARKICAMGVRTSRWVTMHGFAFNINTDLNYFNYIVPCGIQDKQVTSLQKELGETILLDDVKAKLRRHFADVFEARVQVVSS